MKQSEITAFIKALSDTEGRRIRVIAFSGMRAIFKDLGILSLGIVTYNDEVLLIVLQKRDGHLLKVEKITSKKTNIWAIATMGDNKYYPIEEILWENASLD